LRVPTTAGSARGPVWQRSFYERGIFSDRALRDVIDYIEANPVNEGLVSVADQYPFGSASGRFELDVERFWNGAAEGPG